MKLFNVRHLLLLPFFLSPLFLATAQEVDYNRIIPPASPSADFSEKLVRLAWLNYPGNDAVQANVEIARQDLIITKWSWLERITVSGNINEYTLTGGPDGLNRSLFFPRYNFGITLSPGMIFQLPAETKRARENLKIATYAVEEQKLQIRKEVLQRYQEYLMYKQLLALETSMFASATTAFELLEEQFKRGQVTQAVYTEASNAYLAQQRQRLLAETNYIKAVLELEALIGVHLEEVK